MKENNEICKNEEVNCAGAASMSAATPTHKPYYTSRYDDDSWEVSVRLPGVKKSDLGVTVENEILEVVATRSTALPDGWKPLGDYDSERQYRLRLDVGPEVNPSGVSATLTDGVLTLRLPLKDEVRPVSVEVQ